jgi:tetratricopeptide (TPR) repeat protein
MERLPPSDVLARNPAVALFVERAFAVRPDFVLTADNACDVAGICARLDGLPLAIELAAARMKLLSAASLFERLQKCLDLLTGGPHDVPARQQTLRQTIDWSYGFLSSPQQTLFRRLSVFNGGFTPESAEAVCNARAGLDIEVLDGISSLLDHSLVQRVDSQRDEVRFTMLETVREYAFERLLQSGEEEFTRKAHAAYCLVLAEEAHTRNTPGERECWLAACDAEHNNLRAGLGWLLHREAADWALRMVFALFDFWETREHLAEGCDSLQAVLCLPGAAARTRMRAGALWRTGAMLGFKGDFTNSLQAHREALDIYEEIGEKEDIAFQLSSLGACHMLIGDPVEAVSSYERSLQLYRELGNPSKIAQTLSNLAQAQHVRGDQVIAGALHREALAIFRDMGHWTNVGWCLNHLGDVARTLGDYLEARTLYQQGAGVFRRHQDKWGLARSLLDLGELSSEESDYTAAQDLFRQALEIFLALGHKRGVAKTLEALAIDAARQEHSARALTLAGCAAGLRHRTGSCARPGEKRALETTLLPVWEGMESEAGRAVWTSGWRMSLDEAAQYAVSRNDAIPYDQDIAGPISGR